MSFNNNYENIYNLTFGAVQNTYKKLASAKRRRLDVEAQPKGPPGLRRSSRDSLMQADVRLYCFRRHTSTYWCILVK